MTHTFPEVKVVAWRYQPGAPLHPTVRPGLPGCDKPLPCERCGLSVHGELLGYRFIMNPGEWLVAIEDRIAVILPDNMFQRIRGRSAIGPDGVLVDPPATPDDDDEDDDLAGNLDECADCGGSTAVGTPDPHECAPSPPADDDDLDALLEAT